jgi:soluble lytic murein transglycosylase
MFRNIVVSLALALFATEAQAKKPAKKPTISASAPKLPAKSKSKKPSAKPAAPKSAPKPTPEAEPAPAEETATKALPSTEGALSVEAYPFTGKAAEGASAFQRGDFSKAVTALSAYRRDNPSGPYLHPLGYLEVKALQAQRQSKDAIALLETLLAVEGPFTSEFGFLLGKTREASGDADAARIAYSHVQRGSRRYDEARLARARLAPSFEAAQEILAERFYWAKERAEGLDILRDHAQRAKDEDKAREIALQLFREYPLTQEGDAIEEKAFALHPSRADLMGRLGVLLEKKKSKEASAFVKRAEAAHAADESLLAEMRGDIAFFGKDYKEAGEFFTKARAGEDKTRASRRLGNVKAKQGEVEDALSLYKEAYEADAGEESARALLDAVRLLRDKDRLKEARPLAQKAADHFPNAPTLRDSLWISGWLAWRAGDEEEAQQRFDALLAHTGSLSAAEREAEDFERRKMGGGYEERALYWSARARSARGDKSGAEERYRELIERFPLNYYSHQAFDRLRDLGAKDLLASVRVRHTDPEPLPLLARDAASKDGEAVAVSALPGAGKAKPETSSEPPTTWTLPVLDLSQAAVADDPSVRAAVALYGLGMKSEALEELRAQANQETLSTDGGALMGALMQSAEGLSQGTWLLLWKWDHGRYPGNPLPASPTAGDVARGRMTDLGWKIAYPKAYGEVVDHYASKFEVPPEMVFAIMRAESTFRPSVVSPANAVGLTQVLPSTAGWIAKELLGESKPSRSQLFDEMTNIKLGTRFLRELTTLFDGNYALAIASYNAGPGAGMRWYKRWRDLETDELIEEIPINETHGYTKKVLGSMGAYRYLWGDWSKETSRSLDLPRLLPAKLGTYNGKQM